MKKSTTTLLIFILIGLLAGSLLAQVLSHVAFLNFLTHAQPLSWEPKANLDVIKFNFYFEVKISLLSLLGAVAAILIYRKM